MGRQQSPSSISEFFQSSAANRKGPSPEENALEELDFVNPSKPGLRWAPREQISANSFKGASVAPQPRAAASAVSQWGYPHACGEHSVTSREDTRGRAGCTSAAGFGHHRSSDGEEQGMSRKTGESPREGAAAPGLITLVCFAPPQPFLSLCECSRDRNLLQPQAGTVNSAAGL